MIGRGGRWPNGCQSGLDALIELADDADARVRFQVALALGQSITAKTAGEPWRGWRDAIGKTPGCGPP